MDQGHKSESLRCFQGADKSTEAINENQRERDVNEGDHEIEDIPVTPDVSIRDEEHAVRDDLNQEFDDKYEIEGGLCGVKPCTPHWTVLHVIVAPVEGRCDRVGNDTVKDDEEDKQLKERVSSIRG